MTSLGPWQPFSPKDAAPFFAGLLVPWWVAGGWAIDAFLGHQTRPHGDTDIGVLRRDQLVVQAHLEGWQLHAAGPPGTLRPWPTGRTLRDEVHSLWCRLDPRGPWRLQLLLEDADGDDWLYRRDDRVRRPLSRLVESFEGVPYLAVEVQLLFKAPTATGKNEEDFLACLPHLEAGRRRWLAEALALAHPGHPWLERL